VPAAAERLARFGQAQSSQAAVQRETLEFSVLVESMDSWFFLSFSPPLLILRLQV
jgi:hypothetical protein